jgi:WD40 repeat protein/serine/threonine protein kinase
MPPDPLLDESLVARLPLPLAQLYRRAHEVTLPLERHLVAFYLWEATLKLVASVAVVEYAAGDAPDPAIAERLRNLARPSLGHWREFVRLLLPPLAARGDSAFVALHDFFLGPPRDDLPAAAGLDALLRQHLEDRAGARATVALPELLDRLVSYRNRELGHGAVGLAKPAFYERMGAALLSAAAEVQTRVDVLAGRQLVHTDAVRLAGGLWVVDRTELIGERGRRLPPMELPREATDQLPDGERVYLEGPAGRRPLHPLLLYDAEAREVLFLNARRGKRGAQYICYTNNRSDDRADLRGEQGRLLAEVLGLPSVDAGQVADWEARAEADEPAPPFESARPALGEYELISELGRGGMGVVYRSAQPAVRRQVAVKEMLRHGDARTWAKSQARFRREIRALGRVKHPHLVSILTEGKEGDRWFYVMELVEGAPLSRVCERLSASAGGAAAVTGESWQGAVSTACDQGRREERPVECTAPAAVPEPAAPVAVPPDGRGFVARTVELMRQVAGAAHALHEAGIVHRDIKPDNIVVRARGTEAVLMDLGVAQWSEGETERLTTGRDIPGTLRYASPEQVLARGLVDRRSDVYSLGATLWEALALRPLYDAPNRSDAELIRSIQFDEAGPVRPHNPAVPADLDAVLARCLEKDARQRYATARELADDLGRFLRGEPVKARPVRTWERGWKWVKRRPAAAALVAVTMLMVLALVGGGVSLFYSGEVQRLLREAEHQRDIAQQERDMANRLRGDADEERGKAVKAGEEAVRLQGIAEGQRSEADRQRARADGLLYLNRLALAQREIEKSEFGRAAEVLDECPWAFRAWEWGYLRRHARMIHSLEGHAGFVFRACYSPDGDHLASASADRTVRVWDARGGQERLTLLGHTGMVRDVCFSPDGRHLATASWDKTVRVWDARSGREVFTLEGHRDKVERVCFSPNGEHLASAGDDGALRVWDMRTGREVLTLKGRTGSVGSVCFSPDGRHVAGAFWEEKQVRVSEVPGGKDPLTLKGETKVCFSPDGLHLATAGSGKDGTVRLWDVRTGREVLTLKGHNDVVHEVCFSPDGRRLATASFDDLLKVWDAHSGQEIHSLKGRARMISDLAFSPDGRRLASADDEGVVRLWDARTGQEAVTLRGHASRISSLRFDPGGGRLATTSLDTTVKVWDVRAEQDAVEGYEGVCFSPDSRRLAAFSEDGSVRVWDAHTAGEGLFFKGHDSISKHICFSPDGRRLATSSMDKTAKLWDARDGTELLAIKGHTGWVNCVCFSPDGRLLATASQDMTVRVWDATTGTDVLALQGHTDEVHSWTVTVFLGGVC